MLMMQQGGAGLRSDSLITRAMHEVKRGLDSDSEDEEDNKHEVAVKSAVATDSLAFSEAAATVRVVDQELATKALVPGSIVNFKLSTPSQLPEYLSSHFICETASRLLFLSVHWARSIPVFSLLE